MVPLKKIWQNAFFSKFDPSGKSVQYQNKLKFITILMLLVGGICQGLLGLYFSAGYYALELWIHYFSQPQLVILNSLPYIIISFVVWFLTNRAWIGFLVSGSICLLYSFVEYWKIMIRSDPLYAEDLFLVSEAVRISDGYLFFNFRMLFAVFCIIFGTVFFFFFLRGKLFKRNHRIIATCSMLLACVPLYMFVYTSDKIYESFDVWENLDPWIESNQYFSRGGVYPFLYSVKTAVPQPPNGYEEDLAESILKEYESDIIPEDKKVNVIFVMYEAFVDLSTETDRITGGDPYVDYHRLLSESYHGKLVANFYGGGTNNSERCVMTGFSELYHFRHPLWSYVRYFSDNGYATQGSHGGYQTFYNRNNVNVNIGFDEYWFYENRYGELAKGEIPMDNIFIPDITDLALEKINDGQNIFSFNVTFQNHGPYETTLMENAVEYVPQRDLSEEDYAVVNNYLNGIADTGKHMSNMVDTFRDLEEPVILVFFGDHRPSMGDWGSTYENLGISMNGDDDESFCHFYQTEYMILANNAAKKILNNGFTGIGPCISPCFLMNVLFEQCGWEGPSYMKLTDEVMSSIPVVTINDRFLVNGTFVSESELSSDEKELLQKMRFAQFYLAEYSEGMLP